jgi:hypothetical protein
MAGKDYQIDEIERNVRFFAGPKAAAKVMEGREKIKPSTKSALLARWVKGAMDRLDAVAEPEIRGKIMAACGENCARSNEAAIRRTRARFSKFESIEEFVAVEERKPQAGSRLLREGKTVYQFYAPQSFTRPMRCYCSLMRGLPEGENASATFCLCSGAFVKRHWEEVLGKPVSVEVMETCLTGAEECRFRIVGFFS